MNPARRAAITGGRIWFEDGFMQSCASSLSLTSFVSAASRRDFAGFTSILWGWRGWW